MSTARLDFKKSSYSSTANNCVEVAPQYHKSSYSNPGERVEVAPVPPGMAVRDSKRPSGLVHSFAPDAWSSFIGAVKSGEFDA